MGVEVAKNKNKRRKCRSFTDGYKAEVVELVRRKSDAANAAMAGGADEDVHAQVRAARQEFKMLKLKMARETVKEPNRCFPEDRDSSERWG